MSAQLLKQVMMTQMSSASISLVASLVTAAFIAFGKGPSTPSNSRYNTTSINASTRNRRRVQQRHQRRLRPHDMRHHPTVHKRAHISKCFQNIRKAKRGFYNPYRRLIFGLCISDICQSFALLTGPFMVRSDVPQALWGLGNAGTCSINGFLFSVGMTAVPMYTLALCIYYVCKIKGKMTDAQFATNIEKNMHVCIIVVNAVMYLSAMMMGAINPGVMGTACGTAAFPTGCRQNPEMFGECEPFRSQVAAILLVINSFVVPVLCLIGILVCMAMLFWNVIMMDVRFGRGTRRTIRWGGQREVEHTNTNMNAPTEETAGRQKVLSMISLSSSSEDESRASFPVPSFVHTPPCNNEESDNDSNHDHAHLPVSSTHQSSPSNNENREDALEGGREHRTEELVETWVPPAPAPDRDPESISRLYKRELATQACGYVAVFCSTIFLYTTYSMLLVSGVQPGKVFLLYVVALYPLGGFFTILVYTRPNVASFLRRCPECSRLHAFWLVLKAGGEVPDVDVWRNFQQQQQQRKSKCIFQFLFVRNIATRNHQEQGQQQQGEDGSNNLNPSSTSEPLRVHQETISALPYGIPSQPVHPRLGESLPDSAAGINGLSESIESTNIAHRHSEDWTHLEGEGSRMAAIPEGDSSAFESSEMLVSEEEHAASAAVEDVSSTPSSQKQCNKKDDLDEMWEATFDRVKRWTPSM